MNTSIYTVSSGIMCSKCGGKMFKMDDDYGEYLECICCSYTVDIKINSSYQPRQSSMAGLFTVSNLEYSQNVINSGFCVELGRAKR